MAESGEDLDEKFLKEKHVNYCLRSLQILPQRCDSLDSSRLVVAYFALSTLDLLNALSKIESEKRIFLDWIYYLQVVPDEAESNLTKCGFRGSTPCTVNSSNVKCSEYYDKPHIAMTYAALASLLILGDDLSKVNKKSTILSLRSLQLPDGSFRPTANESESDMRFIYCATCICYILQDWNGIDVEKAIDYIKKSLTYEGGIAQGPGLEAHGGSTFCAVASLWLMEKLHCTFTAQQIKNLQRWCLLRQQDGFQGRPNKPSDTCYSFWVGATLKLLDSYQFVSYQEHVNYVLSNQDIITGGIAKWVDLTPDPLHTYLGICGLSLMEFNSISPIHPALNISHRAATFMSSLHEQWAKER